MVALKGVQFIANNIKKNDEDIEVFLDVKKHEETTIQVQQSQEECKSSTKTVQ